ncbi:hypothetical protein A2U01_0102362, partial [Trifolium medium]|nr:hypothetical protein [Trifolium medium]
VLDKDGNKTTEIKVEKDYSKDEDDLALGNSNTQRSLGLTVQTCSDQHITHTV